MNELMVTDSLVSNSNNIYMIREESLLKISSWSDVLNFLELNIITPEIGEIKEYENQDLMEILLDNDDAGALNFENINHGISDFNLQLQISAITSMFDNLGEEKWKREILENVPQDYFGPHDGFAENKIDTLIDAATEFLTEYFYIISTYNRSYTPKIFSFALENNIEIEMFLKMDMSSAVLISSIVPEELSRSRIDLGNIRSVVLCPSMKSIYENKPFINGHSIFIPKGSICQENEDYRTGGMWF